MCNHDTVVRRERNHKVYEGGSSSCVEWWECSECAQRFILATEWIQKALEATPGFLPGTMPG